jgi:hypothetical protein
MKLSQKILLLVESSARDLEGIADFLHNGLEYTDLQEAIDHLVKEFGLHKKQAHKLIDAWNGQDVRTVLKMKTKDDVAWLDNFFDTNESVSEDKEAVKAIVWAFSDEKISDADYKNLYLMADGKSKSDFKPAKKILDMLHKKLKYTIDGFGLADVKLALEQMNKNK